MNIFIIKIIAFLSVGAVFISTTMAQTVQPMGVKAYSRSTQMTVIPQTPVNILFDKIESINGWNYNSKNQTFEALTGGNYQVTYDANVKNVDSKQAEYTLFALLNDKEIPDSNSSIILEGNQKNAELQKSFKVTAAPHDRLRIAYKSDRISTQLSPNTQGESIRLTIALAQVPSLGEQALLRIAKEINEGRMKLEEAKRTLPVDLHQKLDALIIKKK